MLSSNTRSLVAAGVVCGHFAFALATACSSSPSGATGLVDGGDGSVATGPDGASTGPGTSSGSLGSNPFGSGPGQSTTRAGSSETSCGFGGCGTTSGGTGTGPGGSQSSSGGSSGTSSGGFDAGPPCGAPIAAGALPLASNYQSSVGDGGYAYAYDDGTSTACIDSTAFCTKGTTGATSATVYGAGIGMNLNQALATGSMSPPINPYTVTGVGISYLVSSLPAQGLRISIGNASGAAGTDYCAVAPGASGTITWAKFNTKCWDNSGTFLTGAPTGPIHIAFQIPSIAAATPFAFCVDSVSIATTAGTPDSGGGSGPGSSCAWGAGPSSSSLGNPELTCYDFAQGTVNDKTFCGYNGSETGGNNGNGACQMGKLDTVPNVANAEYFAAFPSGTFGQGKYCGMCLNVTYGGNSIVATVVDECATCGDRSGHIDLSLSAAIALGVGVGGAVGNPTNGVEYAAVSCPVTGDIVAVFNGSSSQIYFQNVVFPVASAKASGGAVANQQDGFWSFGTNVAGQTVTLTDVLGHTTSGVIPGSSGTIPGAQFADTCN